MKSIANELLELEFRKAQKDSALTTLVEFCLSPRLPDPSITKGAIPYPSVSDVQVPDLGT